ncbi:hypothetical protein GQ600_15604 [Phytophthora cactorum]|nr:hypothetical protein GQ600_15604 [Phytophthora cactorum]
MATSVASQPTLPLRSSSPRITWCSPATTSSRSLRMWLPAGVPRALRSWMPATTMSRA